MTKHTLDNYQSPDQPLKKSKKTRVLKPIQNLAKIAPVPRVVASDFECKEFLGKGSFGDVFLAHTVPASSTEYALKIGKHAWQRDSIIHEATMLHQLRSPCIIYLYGLLVDQNDVQGAILEYMSNGNLHSYLQQHADSVNRYVRVMLAINIADGLAFMHERGILHRDLKSFNILVNNEQAKISDLGTAVQIVIGETFFDKDLHTTHGWAHPALLSSNSEIKAYTKGTDLYSLGYVFFELMKADCPALHYLVLERSKEYPTVDHYLHAVDGYREAREADEKMLVQVGFQPLTKMFILCRNNQATAKKIATVLDNILNCFRTNASSLTNVKNEGDVLFKQDAAAVPDSKERIRSSV